MKTVDRLAILCLFAFWGCCNPFYGPYNSSLIYASRALADLDPAGVGRDIMFRFDGQSGFTIFTALFRALTASAGPARAMVICSAAALVAGFLGAVVLASALFTGRTRYLALAFGAALPAYYGGFQLFSYAEAAATPRPFAEALVLCGLAALLRDRRALATALMIGAALFHPIMALPGLAILFLWLAIDDRRWWIAAGLVAVGIGFAAWVGQAPFDRLATVIDTEWRTILIQRNPHLFPSLWPPGWFGRAFARTATILIAASLVPAPARRLFLLALGVGLAGLALAYGLNERFGLILVLQAQTWRMMWIVFAISTAGAAVCVCNLWPRGGTSRIALALLALTWIYADYDKVAVMFGCIALGLHFALRSGDYPVPTALLRAALAILAIIGVIGLVQIELADWDVVSDAPLALGGEARRTIALDYDYTPLAVLAAVLAILGWPRPPSRVLGAVSLAGLVAFACLWDQRSKETVVLDSGLGVPDLERLVATKPGEVYWINGTQETWSWLHRPQWLSAIQGASIVFSRDLALRYRDRAHRAIDLGLADDDTMTPLTEPHASAIPQPTPPKVAAFCALPDAPAWIVAPLAGDEHLAAGVEGQEWTAPVQKLEPLERGAGLAWKRVSRYAIIACAK